MADLRGTYSNSSSSGGASALLERLNRGLEYGTYQAPASRVPGEESIRDELERISSNSGGGGGSGSSGSSGYSGEYSVPEVPVYTPPQQIGNTVPSMDVARYNPIIPEPLGINQASMGMELVPQLPNDNEAIENAPILPSVSNNKRGAALDVWERQAAESQGRPIRVANIFGEDYDNYDNGISEMDWIDNQLDLVGNNSVNDTYIRDAVDSGKLSMDDAWALMHEQSDVDYKDRLMGEVRARAAGNAEKPAHVVDDGTSYDYDHMTADKMTGTQYRHYAEMGMGGLPVNEIDPEGVYSKRREFLNNDFKPFTPDVESFANMVGSNVLDFPERLGSMIGNLRTENPIAPDYTISYTDEEGNDKTLSGKDFDRLSVPFIHQYQYDEKFHPEKVLTKPKDGSGYTTLVREQMIPDANGNETYHYGSIVGPIKAQPDGTYRMDFSDGSSVDMSQEYIDSVIDPETDTVMFPDPELVPIEKARGQVPEDPSSLNDVNAILEKARERGESPVNYAHAAFIPNLVMPDGTKVSLNDAARLFDDTTAGDDPDNERDDDIRYGFTPGLLIGTDNRPTRLKNQEIFNEGASPNLDDLGNNAWDWTFGSIPISLGSVTPWIYSLSNATSSLAGVDPSTYDPRTDTYSLIAGNYDKDGNIVYGVNDEKGARDERRSEDLKTWNAAGNAFVPFTEMIVGPVGEQIIPLEKIFGGIPNNPTTGQVLKNFLIGAAGEGIEEDLGNFFEDLTQYGWEGLFANQKKDKQGNPIYDQFSHEVRDYDTSLPDRLRNAVKAEDLANSFAGGVAVDALMDALLTPVSDTSLRQILPAARRDIARHRTGVRQFVDPGEVEARTLNDSFLGNYSDEIDDEDFEELGANNAN